MQAMASTRSAFDRVVALSRHPDFTLTNPNRARSLLHAFAAGNPVGFHRPDGAAYRFIADQVLELDAINPQVAARIVGSFNQWKRYEPGRSTLMKAELQRIGSHSTVSKDVAEIVERALGN
jgi:aminopeptidase N